MAQIRYIVKDVDAAAAFYESCFGFRLVQKFGLAMAILEVGDLTLWIAGPLSSAANSERKAFASEATSFQGREVGKSFATIRLAIRLSYLKQPDE